jgi:hypothetical protein
MISNNSHWKGIFPRDTDDIRNTLTLYFGGFWKRFSAKNGSSAAGDITGITHPFEVPVLPEIKLQIQTWMDLAR